MVNKGLFDQTRDKIARIIVEETDELALAVMAAGVPTSELHVRNLPQNLTLLDKSLVGHVLYIGGLGVPITVKLY